MSFTEPKRYPPRKVGARVLISGVVVKSGKRRIVMGDTNDPDDARRVQDDPGVTIKAMEEELDMLWAAFGWMLPEGSQDDYPYILSSAGEESRQVPISPMMADRIATAKKLRRARRKPGTKHWMAVTHRRDGTMVYRAKTGKDVVLPAHPAELRDDEP